MTLQGHCEELHEPLRSAARGIEVRDEPPRWQLMSNARRLAHDWVQKEVHEDWPDQQSNNTTTATGIGHDLAKLCPPLSPVL